MSVRVVSAVVVVLVAIGVTILAWPQLFGLSRFDGIAQIVSMRGLGIAVGLVLVVALTLLALVSRRLRRFAASIAIVLLVFCAINAAVLSTRGFGNLGFETATDSDVTVLSWNTLGDAPGARAIAQLALDSSADVIALPETTRDTGDEVAAILADSGVTMQVFTIAYDEVSRARSTTLLISAELGEYQVDETAKTTAILPSVVATPVDGSGPTIVAVHTVAPIPPMTPVWSTDLQWVASACDTDNAIVAGDFNATLDHLGGLPHAPGAALGNCFDAALATDNAAVGTWPTALPALLGAPIDHIMATSGWNVTGMRVIESVDKDGSDHRPVLAQLSPTR